MRKDARRLHREALTRTLRTLRPHLKQHRLLALGGLLALAGDVIFRVLEPWPVKYAVDAVTQALGARLSETTGLGGDVGLTLVTWALLLALIVGGRAVCNYASTIAFALVGSRVATQLRSRVFDHVQALSLRYHSRASVGDTSQRLVGDIGRLQEVAVTAGLPLVGNVLTLAVLLVVIMILDPVLSLIVVATAGAYFVLSRFATPKITHASRATRKGEGKLVGSAAEALGAIRVVQAYGLEKTVAHDFADGNERALKAGIRARRLAAGLERSTDLLVGVATAVVLGFGGWQVLRGRMTPGDMVLFLMYLKIAMKPLRDMAKYTGRIARAAASGERIADLMEEPVEIADPKPALRMGNVDGDVAFDRITARDGHGRVLFEDLSLHIPAGQRVGLLGPSGAGKSTLAGYLLRLADADAGSVLIDGYDTRRVTRASLRRHVSILLQESVLFTTTVRENIRYGRLGASDAEVEYAARRAGAHDFITALPEGYDTVLGNRGDTLSGGQRQRVAIARALVRNAPIVILDEATAGLDPASRATVEESLRELTRGRTTLAITHDLGTIQGLDRVLWLEHGRIEEDGAPAELLRDPDSRLARWVAAQTKGTQPEAAQTKGAQPEGAGVDGARPARGGGLEPAQRRLRA
ncbi:ABC transporter ATP-binding protein [Sediminivirga luteola]|jgi:ATP-binding cassette subfamily B protein|uniref:Protein-tyrosine-phosphatase n=1 Tax=Sediminivirga luteola TaxID=1774748 RepID=A0A8J2TYM9_9MICO|nr:ABC transporter ATP-binding protein [Sediminivirga luteola]MCI2265992.1 ABC transporter ATP-binding protein/permease [Sediminivirga luteola]GGA16660.1 protein-tyrosine-phosphatase [Sediminivirga luteola]